MKLAIIGPNDDILALDRTDLDIEIADLIVAGWVDKYGHEMTEPVDAIYTDSNGVEFAYDFERKTFSHP